MNFLLMSQTNKPNKIGAAILSLTHTMRLGKRKSHALLQNKINKKHTSGGIKIQSTAFSFINFLFNSDMGRWPFHLWRHLQANEVTKFPAQLFSQAPVAKFYVKPPAKKVIKINTPIINPQGCGTKWAFHEALPIGRRWMELDWRCRKGQTVLPFEGQKTRVCVRSGKLINAVSYVKSDVYLSYCIHEW